MKIEYVNNIFIVCMFIIFIITLSSCDIWYQVFENSAPVADAGIDQTVNVNALVTLDGSDSRDGDGDKLTYTWFFIDAPAGSATVLYNYTSVNPYLTPDMAGDYVFLLAVSDSVEQGKPDTVTITANP